MSCYKMMTSGIRVGGESTTFLRTVDLEDVVEDRQSRLVSAVFLLGVPKKMGEGATGATG